METTRRIILTGGEFRDIPGQWKITMTVEGEDGELSVIRKPDGMYWELAGVDFFPRSGELVRYDIGDQIIDRTILAQCEMNYTRLREQREKDLRNAGNRSVGDDDALFEVETFER